MGPTRGLNCRSRICPCPCLVSGTCGGLSNLDEFSRSKAVFGALPQLGTALSMLRRNLNTMSTIGAMPSPRVPTTMVFVVRVAFSGQRHLMIVQEKSSNMRNDSMYWFKASWMSAVGLSFAVKTTRAFQLWKSGWPERRARKHTTRHNVAQQCTATGWATQGPWGQAFEEGGKPKPAGSSGDPTAHFGAVFPTPMFDPHREPEADPHPSKASQCKTSRSSIVCMYGKGRGTLAIFIASWYLTMPLASSWKALDMMGAATLKTLRCLWSAVALVAGGGKGRMQWPQVRRNGRSKL